MRKWLPFVVALLPLAAQTADEHANRAAEFVQSRDLKSAEAELRRAIEMRPSDPTLLTSLGGVLGMEGDLHGANGYLRRAVQLDGENPLLRRNLAANQWQLGQLHEAATNLDLLLKSNPRDGAAIFLRGMVADGLHDYTRCIELLESLPEVTTRKPEAAVALADSYYHTNEPEKARAILQPLAGSRLAYEASGVAIAAHDYETAVALLSSLRTPDAAARSRLALAQSRLEIERGNLPQALAMASAGLRDAPDSAELVMTKASLESTLHYYTEAVASWKRALALRPHSEEARRGLATAEWEGGMKPAAIADFEEGLKEFPHDAALRADYGTLLLDRGLGDDTARGTELLRRAIALDDSLAEAHYRLGNALLEAGDLAGAQKELEAAGSLDSQSARVHFALSRLYRRMGRTGDADRERGEWQRLKAGEARVASTGPALGAVDR